MKSKKLIAFLCAAAMTTSAFAGLTITASAASEPVLSLDGSSTAGWTVNDTVQLTTKTDEGSTDSYLDFLSAANKYSSDTVYNLPAAAQLTDDYVIEFDTLLNTGNGMGRLNQYTQVAFTGANPGVDTADYGGDYASSAQHLIDDNGYTNTWNTGANVGQGYTTQIAASVTSRVELQGKWIFNLKNTTPNIATDGNAQIGDGKWVRVRAAVKNGKATITAADSNQVYVDEQQFDADATKLSKILLSFGRADTQNFVPTTATNIKLDNIKVYDGVANAPAFSTTGLRATAIIATPIPAAEKVAGAAPALTIPDRSGIDPVTSVQTSFNALQVGELAHIDTAAQDPVAVGDKMEVQIGSRDSGADAATYASVVKTADGDNAIKMNAGQFSTNGRGPVLSLKDNMSIEDLTGTNSVLGFSAYLSKTQASGMSKLYLFDDVDLSADGGNVDGNGVARYVLAVITTEDTKDEDGENIYTNGDSNIGIHVEEGWHTFTVVVSEGTYRVFVDQQYKDDAGKLSPVLKNTKVGTGDTSKAVVNLPAFAVENRKSDDGTQYSSVLIDNVVAYQFQGDLDKAAEFLPKSGEAAVETPAPTEVPKHTATITWDKTTSSATVSTTEETAFDGVLVHMSYNDDNTLKSVKTYDAKGIVKTTPKAVPFASTDKVYNGDKIVLWHSLESMIPYGSLTVANGETKPTPTPTATATTTATTAPTPTATTTATTAPTPTATTTATTAPTPTATTTATTAPTPTVAPVDSTVTIAKRTGTTFGKTAADFGTVEFAAPTAANVIAATGVLKKVTNLSDMGDTYKDGYFLTYDITIPAVTDYSKVKVSAVSNSTGKPAVPAVTGASTFTAEKKTEDFITFIDPTATKITVTVDLDGDEAAYLPTTYEIDLSGVKLQTASTATIAKRTGTTYGKAAADFGAVTFAEPTAENVIAATGDLKYVKGVTDMGEAYKDGYFLTYDITIPAVADYSKVKVSAVSNQTATTPIPAVTGASTFTAEKKTEDFITFIDPTATKVTVTVDLDGDEAAYTPTTYEINLSALQLESYLTIGAFTGTTYGKAATTFSTEGINFGTETNKIYAPTGTLNYVENLTDMGEAYKDGYFLTYLITLPGTFANATVSAKSDQWTEGGVAPAGTFASKTSEDFITYLANNASKITVKVDFDGEGTKYSEAEYTINLASLTKKASSDADPAHIQILADKTTVAQSGTVTFTKNVTDAASKVTSKNGVTWGVYSNAEATTAAAATVATISADGVLTVAANADVDKLYVKANSSVAGKTDLASNIVELTVEEAVATDATVLTFVKGENTPIAGAAVTATPGSYLELSSASVPAALQLTGTTDAQGKVSLKLNPNRKYTISATLNGQKLMNDVADFRTTTADKQIEVAAAAAPDDAPAAVKAAVPGEEVTVTAEEGKTFASATIKTGTGAEATDVATTPASVAGQTSFKFTMPAAGLSTYAVDYQVASKLSFRAFPSEVTTILGKNVADLATDVTVTVDSTNDKLIKVTGTSPYVEDFTQFNTADVTEQEGNYVPYAFSFDNGTAKPTGVENDTVVINMSGSKAKTWKYSDVFTGDAPWGLLMVKRLADKSEQSEITVDWDGNGTKYTPTTYTVDYSGVTTGAKQYDVTVPTVTGGTLKTDKAKAFAGDTVTLTVAPAEGYALKANSLKVMNGATEVTTTVDSTDSTKYTFTMPAADVNVTAEFEALPVTVSGTASHITGVQLIDKTDATKKFPATAVVPNAETGAYSIANVPLGTYTVKATAETGYKIADSEVTINAPKSDLNLTATAITVPTLAGTTIDESDFSTNDTWGFTTGRNGQAPSVSDGWIILTKGNNSTDHAQNQDVKDFGAALSDDTELIFDYQARMDASKNRYSFLNITDSSDAILFSIGNMSKTGIGYRVNGEAGFTDNASGNKFNENTTGVANSWTTTGVNHSEVLRVYLHFVKGTEGNTISGLIFKVPETGAPVFVAEIPETATTATDMSKIAAKEGYSAAPQALDNVKMVSNSEVKIASVGSVTGGKVNIDKKVVKTGTVINLTATPDAGKKLKSFKLNGTNIEGSTYTVTGSESALVFGGEFVRADVTEVTIASENTSAQKGTNTAIYTATVKAGETTLTGEDAVVTYTAEKAAEGAPTTVEGITFTQDAENKNKVTMTVPDTDDVVGKIVVKASIKKDITNASTEAANTTVGTFNVTIVGEPVYGLNSGLTNNTDHGTLTFTVGENTAATQVKQSESVTVVAHPATGYELDATSVKYKLHSAEDIEANWTALPSPYTLAGTALTGDIDVKATFVMTDYAITNSDSTNIAILVNGEAGTTAHYGDTVTVQPAAATGKKIATIAVTKTEGGASVATNTSFTMPAAAVTVTATVEDWDGVYYSQDFEESSDFTAGGKSDGTTKNPALSTTQDPATNIIGVGSATGDKNLSSPSFTAMPGFSGASEYKVSFDFRIDGCAGTKGSNIGLLGAQSKSSWLDSDKQILNIAMHCTTNGYFDSLKINNVDVMSALKMASTGDEIGSLKRDTTGWCTLDATINFTTKKVTFSVSRGGTTLVEATTVDFVNTDTTVLDRLFFAAGKSYGGVCVDNILITTPWYVAPVTP